MKLLLKIFADIEEGTVRNLEEQKALDRLTALLAARALEGRLLKIPVDESLLNDVVMMFLDLDRIRARAIARRRIHRKPKQPGE